MKKNKILIGILSSLLCVFVLITVVLSIVVIKNKDVMGESTYYGEDYGESVELDVNNSNVVRLFNMAHGPMNMGASYNQYTDKVKLVSDMSYDEKLFYASTTYDDNIFPTTDQYTMTTTYHLKEEHVKNALEYVFGFTEYKQVEKVPYLCGYLNYDKATKEYVGTLACGGNIGGGSTEHIIKAEKYGDVIEVTSAYAYYRPGMNHPYEILKSSKSEEVLLGFSFNEDFVGTVTKFMKENPEKFDRYKYTFVLNKNGFYNFYKIEKVL